MSAPILHLSALKSIAAGLSREQREMLLCLSLDLLGRVAEPPPGAVAVLDSLENLGLADKTVEAGRARWSANLNTSRAARAADCPADRGRPDFSAGSATANAWRVEG